MQNPVSYLFPLISTMTDIEQERTIFIEKGIASGHLSRSIEILKRKIMLPKNSSFSLCTPEKLRTTVSDLSNDIPGIAIGIQADENNWPLYWLGRIAFEHDSLIPVVLDEYFVSEGFNSNKYFIKAIKNTKLMAVRPLDTKARLISEYNYEPDSFEIDMVLLQSSKLPIWSPVNYNSYHFFKECEMENTLALWEYYKFLIGHNSSTLIRLNEFDDLINDWLAVTNRNLLATLIEKSKSRFYYRSFEKQRSEAFTQISNLNAYLSNSLMKEEIQINKLQTIAVHDLLLAYSSRSSDLKKIVRSNTNVLEKIHESENFAANQINKIKESL